MTGAVTMTGPRAWWRGVDPFVGVAAVVSFVVYLLHGFNGFLARDLGVYAYAGERFADGVPPYVGVVNRAGPLAHAIPGLGAFAARVVGKDELLGMRFEFLLLSVACVCLTYVVGRDVFGARTAGIAAAAAFLTFSGFIEYASNGPREKTPMVLFLLCAFWAATRRRWFLAGVSVALATLVLQIGFFVGAPAVLAAVLLAPRREWWSGLLRFAAGGLATVLVTTLYFAAVGALTDFVDGFLLLNLRYTASQPVSLDGPALWRSLHSGYGASLWVFVTGLAVLLVLSAAALHPRTRRQVTWLGVLPAFGAAAVGGIAWTWRDYDSWPDLFPLLPLAALGIGGLARVLSAWAPARVTTVATVAWTVLALVLAGTYSIEARDDTLVTQRRSVAALLGRLPADATVLSLQGPQALVLSGKVNPTRHQMFSTGLRAYIDDTWPGGLAGFVRWVSSSRPALVAVGHQQNAYWAPKLTDTFVRVGCAPGWIWYADRSLGPATTTELRRAAARVPAAATPHGCRTGR